VQRHLTSARTHRAFRATAMNTCAKPLLRRDALRTRKLLRTRFGNVTTPLSAPAGAGASPRQGATPSVGRPMISSAGTSLSRSRTNLRTGAPISSSAS
jgi:hypothetical protein